MRRVLIQSAVVGIALLLPCLAFAQFNVENPPNGGTVSGISLVSGWKCTAGQITVHFDGADAGAAVAYGTSREDTRAVCGDANNGFGLLINWNLLGAGVHTASLRDNEVEFASVTFTVQTFGQEFLKGASGAFTLPNFPNPGGSTRIQWQENQQNFVITNATGKSSGSGSSSPRTNLENPQPGSFQSGIGLISGWACEANKIEVEIDGHPSLLEAAYGTERGDTLSVCGDTDNGFGLLFNWNLLGDGNHIVRVLQDGVEFAKASFTVATLGLGDFPQGLSGTFRLPNFPHPGGEVSIQWQENQQNFVIAGQNSTFAVQNSLTVQRVFTQDGNGTEKTTFAPGDPIQFAAELNNSYGGYLLGANGTQLAITTSFYNDTKPVDIPPGISTWTWNATAPSTAGNYTVTVRAFDSFYGVWVEGSMNFTVGAGQEQLPPKIVRVETFREGQLVFFRVFYTDPNNDAEGFGFRGAKGAGWAEETHPFSSPSFGRVSPGIIEYPFNLGCGTGSEYESDVEVWIYDSTGLISPSVTVHLACTKAGQPPVITLLGDTPLLLTQGCPLVGAGATATDAEDGDLTDFILIDGSVDINAPGQYFLTYSVTNSHGLSDSKTRQVVVFGVIGTPVCFIGSPAGKAPNLVVLVHGCCTNADDVRNDWESFGRLIAGAIQPPTPEQWEVVVWDWSKYTPKTGLGPEQFGQAYNNAEGQGDMLGMRIAQHPYSYVHLIGHSAGARLIWLAARRLAIEKVSNNKPEEWPFIHLTFLDAYTPNYGLGNDDYGNLYEYPKYYSEHYVDKGIPLTNACLLHAFNFDITGWKDADKGDPTGHQWPRYWYQNSVATPGFSRYGYPLSLEGSGKDIKELVNELATYSAGKQCSLRDGNTECKQDVCWTDF